jgi:hypothetical protein
MRAAGRWVRLPADDAGEKNGQETNDDQLSRRRLDELCIQFHSRVAAAGNATAKVFFKDRRAREPSGFPATTK